jgi:hypothetical protein
MRLDKRYDDADSTDPYAKNTLSLLQDSRIRAMLSQYFNLKIPGAGPLIHFPIAPGRAYAQPRLTRIHRFYNWIRGVGLYSKIFSAYPSIKWESNFAILTNEPGDARAVCAGMSEIKHQDPLLQSYKYSYGAHGTFVQENRVVCMAQVAQLMSMQCLQNHSTPIADLDRMIDLSYRNLHVVNLPMHANLASKVNFNTIEFVKCYVRYRRQEDEFLGNHLNCQSPARIVGFEPCYMGIGNQSLI